MLDWDKYTKVANRFQYKARLSSRLSSCVIFTEDLQHSGFGYRRFVWHDKALHQPPR